MKTRTSTILMIGLFVLAGVFSDARPALAQACERGENVEEVPPPSVTAQDVVDSTSLGRFAVAVRDQFGALSPGATTLPRVSYFGCLVRQEGSPWRSGSTYLVTLTADGRVLIHAKNMALGARKLKNSIYYGAILPALRIKPADLADDVAALTAFKAAIAENGGPFNIPNFPGDSGYAAAYSSANFGPVIVLAGFDLDEPHLIPLKQENLDPGDPAITARDVVDRRTLKAFVDAAVEFSARLTSENPNTALSKTRLVWRDPPWRHGSVYLFNMDTNGYTLFHGGFPDIYEFRAPTDTLRDAVTDELILPKIIAAANEKPDGAFVEYYFDDPTDDTDSAEVRKVTYVRKVSVEHPSPDRPPVEFIIGSGIYLGSDEVIEARQNQAVKSVLPQVMRAMTASTVDAVSGRIQQATSGTPPAKGFSLGGASTFADALRANGRAIGNGTFDLSRLLAGSSFTLPLNAAGTGSSGPFGNMVLWGSGDYRNFSGGNSNTMAYDGDVVSANLGVDTRLRADLLAGVSVAWARGAVDYTDPNAVTGESTTTLTSINPYVGWQAPSGMNLWATAGYGWGEVEIDDKADVRGTQASDLSQQMVAAGVNGPLVSSDQVIPGGTTSLRLKGETAFTWADIDGAGTIEAVNLNASRQRLMFEGVHAHRFASGVGLTSSVEMGMRYDGGDGVTGHSLEIGGGLRYSDPGTGLTVEGRARTVPVHSGDYREWGVSGLVRLDPGAAGLGLSLSVQPAWGQTASGVQRLWETGVTGGAAPANQAAGRVNARVAYGIGTTWGGQGVLTPYTDVSLSGEGSRRLSLGGQFNIGPSVRMSLEGAHSRPARGLTNHGVMLRSDLNW